MESMDMPFWADKGKVYAIWMTFIDVGANLVFAQQLGDYKNRPYKSTVSF